jgi:uncharacterized protein
MMKTVVTGATGFVGQELVRRLQSAGDVLALARTPDAARKVLPATCGIQRWGGQDLLRAEVFSGADAVVHLAGEPVAAKRWTAERKREILESRVRSTRRLVESLAGLPRGGRPRVLVSASAIGFYGDRGDTVLDETAAAGSGFLAEVCRGWETAAHAAVELGIRTVTLRIGVVLGPDGGALARMLPIFRAGVGGRLGAGTQWMSWIDRSDLTRLIAFAVDDERVQGPLNAVAPEPVRNREFTAALGQALGRPTLFPVPAFALRLAMGEMAEVVLASQRVHPEKASDLGFRFDRPALPPALSALLASAPSAPHAAQLAPGT